MRIKRGLNNKVMQELKRKGWKEEYIDHPDTTELIKATVKIVVLRMSNDG